MVNYIVANFLCLTNKGYFNWGKGGFYVCNRDFPWRFKCSEAHSKNFEI